MFYSKTWYSEHNLYVTKHIKSSLFALTVDTQGMVSWKHCFMPLEDWYRHFTCDLLCYFSELAGANCLQAVGSHDAGSQITFLNLYPLIDLHGVRLCNMFTLIVVTFSHPNLALQYKFISQVLKEQVWQRVLPQNYCNHGPITWFLETTRSRTKMGHRPTSDRSPHDKSINAYPWLQVPGQPINFCFESWAEKQKSLLSCPKVSGCCKEGQDTPINIITPTVLIVLVQWVELWWEQALISIQQSSIIKVLTAPDSLASLAV